MPDAARLIEAIDGMKADPKAVADQLGHSVDVSLNVYAQTPVELRHGLVNELERLVIQ